jgi:predicted chitinase
MRAHEIITEKVKHSRVVHQPLDPRISNMTIKDVPPAFVAAFQEQGIKDPNAILGHYLVSGKETKARGGPENMDYSGTTNKRIRDTFGGNSPIGRMSDQQLNWLKQDPERFGMFVYGGQQGKMVADPKRGGWRVQYKTPEQYQKAQDGYTYRGRAHLQVTGKENYDKVGKELFPNEPDKLLKNPDLLNDPSIGLKASAIYARLNGNADKKTFRNPVDAMNDALISVGGGKDFGPAGKMYHQQINGVNDFIKNHYDPAFQAKHQQYYAGIDPKQFDSKKVTSSAQIAPSGAPMNGPTDNGPGILAKAKEFGSNMIDKFNQYINQPEMPSLTSNTPAGALHTVHTQTVPASSQPPNQFTGGAPVLQGNKFQPAQPPVASK